MPPKFKPSQKEYIKNAAGRPTNRWRWKHFYLRQTSTQEIIDAINNPKTKKHKTKFLNELVRRGVNVVWVVDEDKENLVEG